MFTNLYQTFRMHLSNATEAFQHVFLSGNKDTIQKYDQHRNSINWKTRINILKYWKIIVKNIKIDVGIEYKFKVASKSDVCGWAYFRISITL